MSADARTTTIDKRADAPQFDPDAAKPQPLGSKWTRRSAKLGAGG